MNVNQKMANPSSAFARIGLYARSETRFFHIALARLLKQRFGSKIVLYSGDTQKSEFYAQHGDEIFSDIVNVKTPHACAVEQALDMTVEIDRARKLESRFGKTFNYLSISNRHLGRGYALGGFYHPRSRYSEETGYINLLHAYNEVMEFWDREMSQRNLTLLMNGPYESAVVSRVHGIPYRVFAGSRYLNFHNWAWNEFYENPEFEAAYNAGEGGGLQELERPYHAHLVNRAQYMKQRSLLQFCKRAADQIARYFWWKLRGYAKARGYYLSQRVAIIYRIWSETRHLSKLATTTLKDLQGNRFVYFPLHQEPESALQELSPEYFYQLSAIAAIARDLPAGVRLAVKETFGAIGRRPRDFYRQIAEFKNVVLLETLELGLDCVRQADAVVTICGTAGFEGAVLGKSVIAFGHHNNYNFLPHIHFIEKESDLRSALALVLGQSGSSQFLLDGQRFLRATVVRSFDMRGYHPSAATKFDPQSVEEACQALERGLTLASSNASAGRVG